MQLNNEAGAHAALHMLKKGNLERGFLFCVLAPQPQNACKKAKISGFTRTTAPKCVQEGQNQQFYPHRSLKMRARRAKIAVLPALRPPNACRKVKNSGFARTAALKCVQESQNQQFYPHYGPKMRAGRAKMAVLPALRPTNACKKAKISGFTRNQRWFLENVTDCYKNQRGG